MSSDTIQKWKALDEEIAQYKINVSSKYLDLTKRKLELTRLPREILLPETKEWKLGTPKSSLEPLLDSWLDGYSWREQETLINKSVPQFRTTVSIPGNDSEKLRIHFVHKHSIAPDAVPLLYVHGYPGSFLEVSKILEPLTSTIPTHLQGQSTSFHVVAPSVPGSGFSDASQEESFGARETASVFDVLMRRLGYKKYVAACSSQGWKIARWLLRGSGCVAVHMSCDGPLRAPPSFVYVEPVVPIKKKSWTSLFRRSVPQSAPVNISSPPVPRQQEVTFREPTHLPQTLAYGLCDSPAGLLASVLQQLYDMGNLNIWSPTEVLNWTMFQWLPGPEAALRWSWATGREEFSLTDPQEKESSAKVSVTVYHEEKQGVEVPALEAFMECDQKIDVIWSRNRTGKAGIPALDAASDVIVDLRNFCTTGRRAGWLKEQDLSVLYESAPTAADRPDLSAFNISIQDRPSLPLPQQTQEDASVTMGDDEDDVQKWVEETLEIEESEAGTKKLHWWMLWRWVSFKLTWKRGRRKNH